MILTLSIILALLALAILFVAIWSYRETKSIRVDTDFVIGRESKSQDSLRQILERKYEEHGVILEGLEAQVEMLKKSLSTPPQTTPPTSTSPRWTAARARAEGRDARTAKAKKERNEP